MSEMKPVKKEIIHHVVEMADIFNLNSGIIPQEMMIIVYNRTKTQVINKMAFVKGIYNVFLP